jgi:predicted RNase H-like nuclease (RuvC/YqgF family)
MEQEAERSLETLALTLDRLAGAANLLEQTVSRLEEQHITMSGQVQKIVATVEQGGWQSSSQDTLQTTGNERIYELERKLHEAVMQIAELRAQSSASAPGGRKTVTAATVSLLAKQGISNLDSIEAGSLDAALTALSIEQRIAVKSQLLRAGLLG